MDKIPQERAQLKTRKTQDGRTIRQFLEELSWVLSTYSHLDFRALPQVLENSSQLKVAPMDYIPPHIQSVVGVLPHILNNKAIFPTKAKIIDFACEALDINISKWERKSKYEIIGYIVCEVDTFDDAKLAHVVTALTKRISGEEAERRVKKELKTPEKKLE
jgi:hypothetical protein